MRKKLTIAFMYDFDKTLCDQDMQDYAFIPNLNMTSEEFCEKLLESQKVAVVPGTAFGSCGEGFIRVSYAYSIQEINVAMERIKAFVESL